MLLVHVNNTSFKNKILIKGAWLYPGAGEEILFEKDTDCGVHTVPHGCSVWERLQQDLIQPRSQGLSSYRSLQGAVR